MLDFGLDQDPKEIISYPQNCSYTIPTEADIWPRTGFQRLFLQYRVDIGNEGKCRCFSLAQNFKYLLWVSTQKHCHKRVLNSKKKTDVNCSSNFSKYKL